MKDIQYQGQGYAIANHRPTWTVTCIHVGTDGFHNVQIPIHLFRTAKINHMPWQSESIPKAQVVYHLFDVGKTW
jgi:hypothetical protein